MLIAREKAEIGELLDRLSAKKSGNIFALRKEACIH
jgi:hypothetical protein